MKNNFQILNSFINGCPPKLNFG
nr:hypothetical protein [Methanobrevibacter sp. TLL-48-HuF1]